MRKVTGFTLLEILLVIAAIGVLAAIVIVAINPARQLAQVRDAERTSEINALYKSLSQYVIDNGEYPPAVEATPSTTRVEICRETVDTGTCTSEGLIQLNELVPTYLATIPEDPTIEGNSTGYTAYLSNGRVIGIYSNRVETSEEYPEAGASWTVTLDSDVFNYMNRLEDKGVQISDRDLAAVDTFVKALKSDNLWSEIDEIGTFTGETLLAAQEKLKFVNTSELRNISFVESDFQEGLGIVNEDASDKFFDTDYVPINEMSSNDTGHLSIYLTDIDTSVGTVPIGAESLNQDLDLIYFNYGGWSGGEISGRNQSAGGSYTPGVGFYLATRESANSIRFMKEGTTIVQNTNTLDKQHANAELYVGGINFQDSPTATSNPGAPIDGSFAYYSVGEGLTTAQVSTYSGHVVQLMADLDRPTP